MGHWCNTTGVNALLDSRRIQTLHHAPSVLDVMTEWPWIGSTPDHYKHPLWTSSNLQILAILYHFSQNALLTFEQTQTKCPSSTMLLRYTNGCMDTLCPGSRVVYIIQCEISFEPSAVLSCFLSVYWAKKESVVVFAESILYHHTIRASLYLFVDLTHHGFCPSNR